jgi:hypothetical protein
MPPTVNRVVRTPIHDDAIDQTELFATLFTRPTSRVEPPCPAAVSQSL